MPEPATTRNCRERRKKEGGTFPSLALPCLLPLPHCSPSLFLSTPRHIHATTLLTRTPSNHCRRRRRRKGRVHLNPSKSHRPPDPESHLSYLLSFIDSIHSPVIPRVSPLEKCPHTQERRQIFVEDRFSYLQRKFHRIQLIDDYF